MLIKSSNSIGKNKALNDDFKFDVMCSSERRNVSNSRDQLLQEQNAAYLASVRADQEKVSDSRVLRVTFIFRIQAEQRAREENERRLLEEEEQRKLQVGDRRTTFDE